MAPDDEIAAGLSLREQRRKSVGKQAVLSPLATVYTFSSMVKRWLVVREVAGSRLAGSQHKFTTIVLDSLGFGRINLYLNHQINLIQFSSQGCTTNSYKIGMKA